MVAKTADGVIRQMLEWPRSKILALAKPIHVRLRTQKLKLFESLTGHEPGIYSLLDVGGGLGLAREFVELYRYFKNVTVVNLCPSGVDLSLGQGAMRLVAGDGCMLPFPSQAFDWVFSNAVIEHVGGPEKQQAFANEIRRVARIGYFVCTPNKYFPIEPHTYLPLYQFLSVGLQRKVVRFAPGTMRQFEEIHLLCAKTMKSIFPEAQVISSSSLRPATSLIAYYPAVPSRQIGTGPKLK